MSSTASQVKVTLISSSVLLVSGCALGYSYIVSKELRAQRAERLTTVAETQLASDQIGEAAVSLQVARWLDDDNSRTLIQSARLAIERGNAQSALDLLSKVGDNPEVPALKMRALALRGSIGDASSIAEKVLQTPGTNTSDALAATALMKFGTPTSAVSPAAYAAVSAQEAPERLRAIASDNVSAAQELYAQRLLSASKALLDCVEIKSVSYYQLQATLELSNKADKQHLIVARTYLEKAARLNPASTEVRKRLVSINEQLEDDAAAAKQRELLRQLESGQI